jgi:hypothetical protein
MLVGGPSNKLELATVRRKTTDRLLSNGCSVRRSYDRTVARFEQRISEADVTAARNDIAGGASLRSAAAKIPCAPSTLSLRIRKAEQAVAGARHRAGIRDNAEQREAEHAEPHAIAAREGVPGDVGPVEILRGALLATKASGQPDWPTRVSAARALAQLRPEELAGVSVVPRLYAGDARLNRIHSVGRAPRHSPPTGRGQLLRCSHSRHRGATSFGALGSFAA